MATNDAVQGESFYSGSILKNLGLYLLGTLITVCTLGFGFPIAADLVLKYKNNKVKVNGAPLLYNGNISNLFKVFVTGYATVIAALVVSAAINMVAGKIGLYCMFFIDFLLALFGAISCLNYIKEKTSFENSEGGSYFDGTTFQLFLLCVPAAILPIVVGIVTTFVKMPCALSLILRLVAIFACVLIFVNSFTPWVIEHSMTSGKCYTFKGTVLSSIMPVLILTGVIFIISILPALIVEVFDTILLRVLMSILFGIILLVLTLIALFLLDVWACANRYTVPENAREVNNAFTKTYLSLSEQSKNCKKALSAFDEKLRDGFSAWPTVAKIIFVAVVAVVVAYLFYLIFN